MNIYIFIRIMGIIMMLYTQCGFTENTDFVIKNTFALNFPEFSKVNPNHLLISIDNEILNYHQIVDLIINKPVEQLDWEHIMQPLEDADAKLEQLVNIISHLHAVKDNDELRKVYSQMLPKISEFEAKIFQNKNLYQKILQLSATSEFKHFNSAQQKIIKDLLLNFKLAGINLSIEKQIRYKEITTEISKLSDQFAKNLLDATQSWSYYIAKEHEHRLNGLPTHVVSAARDNAVKHGKSDGWVITLDVPSVDAVLRYATDRNLRKIIYKAHVTKASEQFPQQFIKFDNSKIMQNIIKLRAELAVLLGFKNYSEYSIVKKLAKSTDEVLNFLNELTIKSLPIAKKEFAKLQEFANSKDQITSLQAWDVTYYAEQYKQHLYNLSNEELRNYFSLNKVLSTMFGLVNTLYGIKVTEVYEFDPWDPMVKLYKVTSNNDELYGFFYLDLYVRENKQQGAWMGSCLSRHKWGDGKLQYPIAFLITNFTKPEIVDTISESTVNVRNNDVQNSNIGQVAFDSEPTVNVRNNAVQNSNIDQVGFDKDPLLYHHEVETLLHEFGHVLHHILTKVDYISAAGCNGVAWDAVELPSQFMEKWAYDWDFLNTVAVHRVTKQRLSKEQFDNLVKIKNYNAGLHMVRQLQFAIFDFTLHMWMCSKKVATSLPNIQKFVDLARAKLAVVPIAKFDRFQNGMSHIFSGGYAAGYYSYSWAEVLAADAYMAFHDLKQGKNANYQINLGKKFLENVLQMGGSQDAMDLYITFRGNTPNINSLLEYNGLINK